VTRLFLIRHAHHDYIGRAIAGWLPGVGLSAQGREQAAALPGRLARCGITALYSSPLERAVETAAPLAERWGLRTEIREGLREIDFGEWSGRSMAALGADPAWRQYVEHRSTTRAPAGELMLETQARMVAELERIRAAHPDAAIAVVSHCDVIRAAVLYYAGMPLDFYQRLEIRPASVSVLGFGENSPQILRLNDTGELV
jgi:probable phosphoglycerate mutase